MHPRPAAYTDTLRRDPGTAEDYLAITEYAAVKLTATSTRWLDSLWPTWRSSQEGSSAAFIVAQRCRRDYGSDPATPGRYVGDESWEVHALVRSRAAALLEIAAIDDGGLRAVAGNAGMERAIDAVRAKRAKQAEKARIEAKRAAAKRAEQERVFQGNAAFRRMRDGSPSGEKLATRWNEWIKSMRADKAAKARFAADGRLMALYDAALNSVTVSEKRKTVKAMLDAVEGDA